MPSDKQQGKAPDKVQLFDTSVFVIEHPPGNQGMGWNEFQPWALPTTSATYLGVKRYCPHFDFLADIAAHCGVDKLELATTDLYCGHFAKEEYTAMMNLGGRQGTDYHQSCFCVRLFTALCGCHQALQALQRREDETPNLLPAWIYSERNPSAIIAHKGQIQESVNKAYAIHEALVVTRIVTSRHSSLEKLVEAAAGLLHDWKEEIRTRIIDLLEDEIRYIDVAPKLCPEAPLYRSFEGVMS